ncbi:MAG: hypothetical protein WA988_12780, partial [Candidatus Nanopelagicales bacterium]
TTSDADGPARDARGRFAKKAAAAAGSGASKQADDTNNPTAPDPGGDDTKPGSDDGTVVVSPDAGNPSVTGHSLNIDPPSANQTPLDLVGTLRDRIAARSGQLAGSLQQLRSGLQDAQAEVNPLLRQDDSATDTSPARYTQRLAQAVELSLGHQAIGLDLAVRQSAQQVAVALAEVPSVPSPPSLPSAEAPSVNALTTTTTTPVAARVTPISGLLAAMTLGTLNTGLPSGPADLPGSWVVLAWVRRQAAATIDEAGRSLQSVAPLTSNSQSLLTTSTLAPSSLSLSGPAALTTVDIVNWLVYQPLHDLGQAVWLGNPVGLFIADGLMALPVNLGTDCW